MKYARAFLAATMVVAFAGVAQAASVTISGTHTVPNANVHPTFGNYRPFQIDTSVVFRPGQDHPSYLGPVTVSGSVDISSLQNNSSVFVGLITVDQYNAWEAAGYDPNNSVSDFFGFIDTAYVAFNTLQSGRIGLGQQLSFASNTQTYGGNNLGTNLVNWNATFDISEMDLTVGANPTVSQAYSNNLFNYLDGTTGNATDWSSGAYAFIGTFFDGLGGAPVIDVTFSQATVIPVPPAAGLILLGMVGMGLRRKFAKK